MPGGTVTLYRARKTKGHPRDGRVVPGELVAGMRTWALVAEGIPSVMPATATDIASKDAASWRPASGAPRVCARPVGARPVGAPPRPELLALPGTRPVMRPRLTGRPRATRNKNGLHPGRPG